MSRKFTAQEMREMATEAEVIEVADQFFGRDMDTIAAMLRQAADALEREEREAKDDDKNKPLQCPSCGGEVKIKHMVGGYSAVCECGYCAKFCDSESEAISVHNRVAGSTKRKKRYEYVCYGRVFRTLNGARIYSIENECQGQRPTIFRREVGEWEHVEEESK